MLKRSYKNRKLSKFTCTYCGKEAEKPTSELVRNEKLSRPSFCCRHCASSYNIRHHRPKTLSPKQIAQLKNMCEKAKQQKRDEYSCFRYTFRSIIRRCQQINITLDDLKEQWDLQKGICPYTNLQLTLPEENNLKTISFWRRASLDRIDSSLGYVKGNIQWIALPINLMKLTFSNLETKRFLKEISTYTSTFVED